MSVAFVLDNGLLVLEGRKGCSSARLRGQEKKQALLAITHRLCACPCVRSVVVGHEVSGNPHTEFRIHQLVFFDSDSTVLFERPPDTQAPFHSELTNTQTKIEGKARQNGNDTQNAHQPQSVVSSCCWVPLNDLGSSSHPTDRSRSTPTSIIALPCLAFPLTVSDW